MSRTAILLVVVILTALTTGTWAQAPASGSAAAAATSVAAVPSGAAATAARAEHRNHKLEMAKKAQTTAAEYLVRVATRWQKDQGEYPTIGSSGDETGNTDESGANSMESSVDGKRSTEKPALLLDPAAGLVLAPDGAVEPRFIEFIKGFTADGKEFPLKLFGFYLNTGGTLYQTDKWPGTPAPLPWVEGKVEPFSEAFETSLTRGRLGWEVSVEGASSGGELIQASDRPMPEELLTSFNRGNLIFDESARPLGFILEDYPNSVTGGRFPWRGTDLATAPVVKMADFEKAKPERIDRLGKYVYEIKIVYRQPEEGEENLQFEGDDRTSLTQYYYGYAVSPTQILVPVKLGKVFIQRIKQITVQVGEREVRFAFRGAYLNFGGFLIEFHDNQDRGFGLPQVLPLEGPALPEVNRAMLTYVAERKFGRRRDTVWYNRLAGYSKGYNDRLWPRPLNDMARGTLALTFDEKPLGLCLPERQPEREKKDGEGRYGANETVRLYRLSELAAALKNPQEHFDPTLKPASEQEEKRTVWLGVEYQAMSPELAAMLDDLAGGGQAQKLSRNGELGLRVTWVHKHSPAEKAGLASGDVLLEIREEGKDEPIELRPRGEDGGGYSGYVSRSRSRGGYYQGQGGRAGYLTGLLTRLGAGTKITLVYLHGQEKVSQPFTLEWAPYDNASANKFKDEKTGVTVKDLTYDVRALLRLADDQPGVIVSKTEDGQKAAVADISQGVIITEINGKPLKNVEDYEQAMTAIQQGKTGTAVMKLLWMGKNRMVKIEFP